jgi:hypothetical protein
VSYQISRQARFSGLRQSNSGALSKRNFGRHLLWVKQLSSKAQVYSVHPLPTRSVPAVRFNLNPGVFYDPLATPCFDPQCTYLSALHPRLLFA